MSWEPVVLWATCGLGICLAITGLTLGSHKMDNINVSVNTSNTSIVLHWTGDSCEKFSAELNSIKSRVNASCTDDGLSGNVSFANLTPGELYMVMLYNASTQVWNGSIRTFPATVCGLNCTPNEDYSTTALDVVWEPATGDKTGYNITYTAVHDTNDTRYNNTKNESITFYDLTPGRMYNINVFTISEGLENQDPAITTGQTVPATVRGLNCTPNEDNSTTALDVVWERADGDSSIYKIMYTARNDSNDTKCINTTSKNITFNYLTPGRMYNISVFTISGDLENQDSTTTTGQTVPATVHGLSCTPNKVNNLTTINVRWEPAEGDSTLYNITYMAKYYIDTKWDTTSNEDMMIYNLTPGRIYSIIVFTISSDLKSQNPAITTCQTVPATVHGLNCTPNKDNRTTVLDVFWEPVDGDCTGYHILCQASNTDDDSYSGDSYNHHFTCRELTPGRMYNVSVFTISGDFSSRSTFSFGQTEPANVPSVNVAGYGKRAVVVKWDPARGDKDAYFVDLYAEDKLIHSVNTSVIDNVLDDAEVIIDHLNFDFQYDAIVKTHSHALNSTGTCSSGHSPINVDLIVELTVPLLLAVIIVATGGLLFIKKRRIKKKEEVPHDLSLRCQNTSISLSQFDNYYCDLEANSELGFSEQFANLQDVGRYEMISVARLPESREKNLYANILP